MDAISVNGSSNDVGDGSTIVDWSSLVVEPKEDGDGILDEKSVDETTLFALLGVKTEADERERSLVRFLLLLLIMTSMISRRRLFPLMIKL